MPMSSVSRKKVPTDGESSTSESKKMGMAKKGGNGDGDDAGGESCDGDVTVWMVMWAWMVMMGVMGMGW